MYNTPRKIEEREETMSTQYLIEGFKSKTTLDEEDTKILDFRQDFGSLEEAAAKAREFFEKDRQLGLAVIYRHGPAGDHQGLKFIFKNQEGSFEEADLYWGDWLCREG